MNLKNQNFKIFSYIFLALVLRFVLIGQLLPLTTSVIYKLILILLVFALGIGYVFNGTATVIEETTEVLKKRTGLAGGFLQAFGTAFPDMVIGVVAAAASLSLRDSDYARAINLAILAAATTFGSNIYNILFGFWCIFRQNISNKLEKNILMFPGFDYGGKLRPFSSHQIKPLKKELDDAISILTTLSLLTAFVAVTMVLFGQVHNSVATISGDLYQLISPVGVVLFILCALALYLYRKSTQKVGGVEFLLEEEKYYDTKKTHQIWLDLILAGVAILFTAESMVSAMEVFSNITHVPFVITGILSGIIGCFGEMLVIYNFSVNPKGRIGDAVVGVAMDNIVTTLGAAIVAIMGGIFLGGNSLIVIFIVILAANTALISQISTMKNDLEL